MNEHKAQQDAIRDVASQNAVWFLKGQLGATGECQGRAVGSPEATRLREEHGLVPEEVAGQIIHDAMEILIKLEHRGAVSADGKTGDGDGLLIDIPHDFFVRNTDFDFTIKSSWSSKSWIYRIYSI